MWQSWHEFLTLPHPTKSISLGYEGIPTSEMKFRTWRIDFEYHEWICLEHQLLGDGFGTGGGATLARGVDCASVWVSVLMLWSILDRGYAVHLWLTIGSTQVRPFWIYLKGQGNQRKAQRDGLSSSWLWRQTLSCARQSMRYAYPSKRDRKCVYGWGSHYQGGWVQDLKPTWALLPPNFGNCPCPLTCNQISAIMFFWVHIEAFNSMAWYESIETLPNHESINQIVSTVGSLLRNICSGLLSVFKHNEHGQALLSTIGNTLVWANRLVRLIICYCFYHWSLKEAKYS